MGDVLVPAKFVGNIRQRIDMQYQALKDTRDIIEELRKLCPHAGTRVGWYSWRPGAMHPKVICQECDHVVGDPTEEQTSAFLRAEEEKRSSKCPST